MKLVPRQELVLDMTNQCRASQTFGHQGHCEVLEGQVDAIKEPSRKVGVGVEVGRDGVNGIAQWSPGANCSATSINW